VTPSVHIYPDGTRTTSSSETVIPARCFDEVFAENWLGLRKLFVFDISNFYRCGEKKSVKPVLRGAASVPIQ